MVRLLLLAVEIVVAVPREGMVVLVVVVVVPVVAAPAIFALFQEVRPPH